MRCADGYWEGTSPCGAAEMVLALETSAAHSGKMADGPKLTIEVAKDAARPGCYRWNVSENMRLRDKSLYSLSGKPNSTRINSCGASMIFGGRTDRRGLIAAWLWYQTTTIRPPAELPHGGPTTIDTGPLVAFI